MIYAGQNLGQSGRGASPRESAAKGDVSLAMRIPAVILVLAVLLPACTLMPPEGEQLRVRQMENAVLPMASAALESGQVETARRLYQRLLGVDPASVTARMGLGRVALREHEPAAAARWFLAALSHAEEPEQRHEALLAHGRAALAASQVEAAGESFARLVEAKDNPRRANLAWGHNGVGLTRLLSGDLPGAVASLERAVLLAPEEHRFQGNLDRALAMQEGFPAPGRAGEDAPSPGRVGRQPVSNERSAEEPQDHRGAPSVTTETLVSADSPLEPDPLAIETTDSVLTGETMDVAAAEPSDAEPTDSSREPEPSEAATDELPQLPDSPAIDTIDFSPAPDPLRDSDSRQDNAMVAENESVASAAETPFNPTDIEGVPAPDREAPSHRAAISGAGLDLIPNSDPDPDANPNSDTSLDSVTNASSGEIPSSETSRDPIASRTSDADVDPGMHPESDAGGSPVVRVPETYPPVMVVTEDDGRYLQFGAYAKRAVAEAVADSLGPLSEPPAQISETSDASGTPLHRVRIGPIDPDDELWEWIERLESRGYQFVSPASASAVAGDSNAKPHRRWNTWLVNVDGKRYLQAGAYRTRGTADSVATELRGLTDRPVRVSEFEPENGPTLHRVRIGPLEPDDSRSELLDYPR